jgi:hypothetical protein
MGLDKVTTLLYINYKGYTMAYKDKHPALRVTYLAYLRAKRIACARKALGIPSSITSVVSEAVLNLPIPLVLDCEGSQPRPCEEKEEGEQ